MTQRLFCQLSLNSSLSFAVSTLALTTGFLVLGIVNPQTIGNTVSLPDLDGAMTETMSVGLISPSFLKGRESAIVIGLVREECSAFSMYGCISGDCLM